MHINQLLCLNFLQIKFEICVIKYSATARKNCKIFFITKDEHKDEQSIRSDYFTGKII